MAGIDWNTGAIGLLRRLWAEGHATEEIGRRMGISKSAVCGKVHRLCLAPRASPIRRAVPAEPSPAPGPRPYEAATSDKQRVMRAAAVRRHGRAVLDWFVHLAAAGAPCPSNDEITARLAMQSHGHAASLVTGMVEAGMLTRELIGRSARVLAAPDGSWRLISVTAKRGAARQRATPAAALPAENQQRRIYPQPRPSVMRPALPARPLGSGLPAGTGCRWPLWPNDERPAAGEHRFCDAADRVSGRPYCARHAAIAFTRIAASSQGAAA